MPRDLLADDTGQREPIDLLADTSSEIKQNKEIVPKGDNTIMDKLGITSPIGQFAFGVAASPLAATEGILSLIGKVNQPTQIEEMAVKKLKGMVGLTPDKKYIKLPELGSGMAYNIGSFSPMVLGGGVGGLSKIPAALSAVENIGNITKGISELKNASTIAKDKVFSQIKNSLGGDKTRLENAEEFGGKLKNNYLQQKEIGVDKYNKTFGGNGDKLMYETGKEETPAEQMLKTGEFGIRNGSEADIHINLGKYLAAKTELELSKDADLAINGIPKDIRNASVPISIKDKFDNFIQHPSFDNSHELQSQVGYEVRNMEKSNYKGFLDLNGKQELYRLKAVRDQLNINFKDRLNQIDPTGKLSKNFTDSTEYWAKNITPYERHPILSQIVKSKNVVNPSKIMSSIPSILKSNDIDVIAGHMGPSFDYHIIANEVGGIKNLDSAKLVDKIKNLDTKGLDIYVPDELSNAVENLDKLNIHNDYINKLNNKLILTRGEASKVSDVFDIEKKSNIDLKQNLSDNITNEIFNLNKKLRRQKIAKTIGWGTPPAAYALYKLLSNKEQPYGEQ